MDTKQIAADLARESIVLLKNEEQLLPLKETKLAFFGRSQLQTYVSGNGSGAARGGEAGNILSECEKQGITAYLPLKEFYQKSLKEEEERPEETFDFANVQEGVNSGLMYEIFGRYHAPAKEYEVSDTLLGEAAQFSETAVLVIGRNAGGEECDRRKSEDFELTCSEKELADKVCRSFKNVVLILNINGLIDLGWTKKYPTVKSILFLGLPGESGAQALAEILTGVVNPSGKLAMTIADSYEDYPAAEHFSFEKENPDKLLTYESYGLNAAENGSVGFEKSPVTVYQEDIYLGYRYFTTFKKKPLFPFGHGLSYTKFDITSRSIEKTKDGLKVLATVRNSGACAGKEVVQVYLSVKNTKLEHPEKELKGFAKTKLLRPQETEILEICLPWEELASYSEEKAAFLLEKGIYEILTGTSSENTSPVGIAENPQEVIVRKCTNRLGIRECNKDRLSFLTRGKADLADVNAYPEEISHLKLLPEDIKVRETKQPLPCRDLSDFSDEQLAALCVGYGPGIPFAAFLSEELPNTISDQDGRPLTTNSHPKGFNGYVSPAIEEKGIRSVFYKDGPAGIGKTIWPSQMLLACAFNREMWRIFGDAAGAECEEEQVNVWLAPAVNLQRHPLGGRNFEYFSEDPYLSGSCACEIAKGVQENHRVLVCPKHFAVNEQETFRRGSAKKQYDAVDSILTERAARELYLKPFEMLVREADIHCLMTSFNKINGVFAGGNKDLCSVILREEWGFHGAVVTDWGDMDIVVDGADAVEAGNDIVMPGGPPVIEQILKGLSEHRVTRNELEQAVNHLLYMIER